MKRLPEQFIEQLKVLVREAQEILHEDRYPYLGYVYVGTLREPYKGEAFEVHWIDGKSVIDGRGGVEGFADWLMASDYHNKKYSFIEIYGVTLPESSLVAMVMSHPDASQ